MNGGADVRPWPKMPIAKRAAVLRKVRALGLVSTYAAVALFATVSFFFLHHLGNRIPYELALQRFRTEVEAGRPDEGQARRYKTDYEYCQISEAVLAGAQWARGEFAAREAVILKTFDDASGARGNCHELDAALNGAAVGKTTLKTQYWWGSKALHALALRRFSVHEIRELTRIFTRIAYVLLAVSLAAFVPGTLPAAAPLLAFGAFFSGVEYWADVANGTPYLWTVLSAAVLAGLLRGRRPSGPGAVPLWCFAAGTVSSYLWLGDGHAFLAVTWIGLLVWFGGGAPNAAERTRRAVSCIALYVAGFLTCYGLGQIVKALVGGGEPVWSSFRDGVAVFFERSAADLSAGLAAHLGAYLDSFYAMVLPSWLPTRVVPGVVPMSVAASALAAAAGCAVFQARRGRPDPLWSVLWIAGLTAAVSTVGFMSTDDIPYRTARLVFVPLALCWSGLAVSVRTMGWKLFPPPAAKFRPRPPHVAGGRLPPAGALAPGAARGSAAGAAALSGIVLAGAGSASWYFVTLDARTIDGLVANVEGARLVIRSDFDVYSDGDRLVYVKEECGAEDVDALFFLHLYPVDAADLPAPRRPHGFENLDFAFERYGLRGGGRCAAARALPGYGIASIHTGQYVPGQDPVWSGRVGTGDATIDELFAGVEGARPVIRSSFDVYLDGSRLVYVKRECGDEDVDAWFFLHVYPVDEADLPAPRRPHGFENLDFVFGRYGLRGGGRCAAARALPEYGIASIHTGQYVPGQDPDWDERVSLEAYAP